MKKRTAAEDAEESEAKRQKKPVSLKRSSPDSADQSVAKRQKTNTEEGDQYISTSDSAPMAAKSNVATEMPKKVSFAPDTKDVSDEEPSPPRRKKTYGRSRQNFLDYISGVPPDPAPAKGRAKRAATRASRPPSGSSSHASTTRSTSVNGLGTATLASLAAEHISVIDFAYYHGRAAVSKSPSPTTVDESVIRKVEESTATPGETSSPDPSKESGATTCDSESRVSLLTVHEPPGRDKASPSGKRDGVSPEDPSTFSRERYLNEEMKQSPAPHKRVAQLRDAEKPSGIRKRKKAARDKRRTSPMPTSRRRYGLRSERKMISHVNEAEEEV